jgi:hypothetical protein
VGCMGSVVIGRSDRRAKVSRFDSDAYHRRIDSRAERGGMM